MRGSSVASLISKCSKTCTILSCGNYVYDSYTGAHSLCYHLIDPALSKGPALTPLPAGPVSPKSAQVGMSSAVICLGRWWKCLDDGSISLWKPNVGATTVKPHGTVCPDGNRLPRSRKPSTRMGLAAFENVFCWVQLEKQNMTNRNDGCKEVFFLACQSDPFFFDAGKHALRQGMTLSFEAQRQGEAAIWSQFWRVSCVHLGEVWWQDQGQVRFLTFRTVDEINLEALSGCTVWACLAPHPLPT